MRTTTAVLTHRATACLPSLMGSRGSVVRPCVSRWTTILSHVLGTHLFFRDLLLSHYQLLIEPSPGLAATAGCAILSCSYPTTPCSR